MFLTVSIIIILSQISPITSSDVSSVCSFNATTVSAVPGQDGYLTSHNYYPSINYNNADCRWLIDAGSGYVVKVTFLNVSLQEGLDVVYLYDGTQLSDTFIIIKSSSMTLESVFYSSGQYMYIRFYSDGHYAFSVFTMTYEAVEQQSVSTSVVQSTRQTRVKKVASSDSDSTCSDNTTALSAVVGEVSYLESLDYPNYPNNASCHWLITAPTGYIVRVTLLEVSLDECCDYLNFVDGMSDLAPSLGRFYALPSQRLLNSSGQYMYINFSTNGFRRRGGFNLYYEAVLLSECPVDVKNVSFIPGEIRYLTSPNYPLNYHNNADCRWLMSAPSGYVVWVTVWTVNVDLYNDYLQILDGMLDSSPRIATLRSTPSQKIYSSCGQYMLIRFFTNFLNVNSGFNLTCEIRPTNACFVDPKNLTAVVGEDKLLDFNTMYHDCRDLNCRWLITAPTGYVVRVALGTVFIWECCGYVSLVDGMSVLDPSLGRFNVTPSQPIYSSSGPYMYIDFSKNGIKMNGALSLYYEAVRLSECPIEGKNLSVVPGQFHDLTSPNYPLKYYNYADCRWLIDAGNGYVVKVTVLNFSLEACCDYLELYDDTHGVSTSLIIRTTSMPLQSVFYSSGQYMYIRFYSDVSFTNTGFRLTYEAASDPKITSTRALTPATTTSASTTGRQRVINVKVVYRKKCRRN